MDRFGIEKLITIYMYRYSYSRENAIKAIMSDLSDLLRTTVQQLK